MPNRTEDRPKVGAATGKSRCRPAETWNLAALPRLARGSLYLGLVMALGGPSCLLTDNPQFEGPEALGPFLRVGKPDPLQVLKADKAASGAPYRTDVTFDVYSEDLGHPLLAYLVIDWTGSTPQILPYLQIEPGHLGTTIDGGQSPPRPEQTMPFQMPSNIVPGCHTLTLVVTRRGTKDDTASVTWVLDVDDGDPPNLLSGCPGVSATATFDAGRDR